MKLWYDRKSKDPMYFVQVGIRNGKKVTTKNVERIGKHSELLKQGQLREELQAITGLSKDKVIRAIPMLLKRNLINKEGEGKATIYIRTDK